MLRRGCRQINAENEVWSGLLSVFLSELETLWCLCTQTVAQDLVSTDARWLASLSILHGWLAAVCCVVRSGSGPLITFRAALRRPQLGFTPAFPVAPPCSGTHLDLDPSLHVPHTLLHGRPTLLRSISSSAMLCGE